jgi:diguanylate cyclase (GGDEF)-like protein
VSRARMVLLAVAAAVVCGGLLITPEPPPLWRFLLAVCLLIGAQQLAVPVRVGAAVPLLTWAEAVVILGLVLVPAGWLPLVFVAGGAFGMVGWWLRGLEVPQLGTALRVQANTAIAAAAGAVVGHLAVDNLSDWFGQPPPPDGGLSLATAAGLVLAAVAYLATAVVTFGARNAVRLRATAWRLALQTLHRKALMFLGSVTFSLTAIALAYADWRWLPALAPVVWLLHRAYGYQQRVVEHRRIWGAFAEATRSLNRGGEEAVAVAGVRGAMEVFSVGRADVALDVENDRGDGSGAARGHRRAWAGDQTGAVWSGTVSRVGVPPDVALAPPSVVPLLAGDDRIGELRVYFPSMAGPGGEDEAVLKAYGAALGAAVQDAATHQELRRLLADSARAAQRDPLTGLYGRPALLAYGDTAIQLTRQAAPVALLLVDVDHFREINDTLGHAAGDEVLRVTAQRLHAAARPGDLLGRLAGDEFAMLLTDPPAAAGAAWSRATELAASLGQEVDIGGTPVSVGVTVGAVVAPAGTADLAELLRRADTARVQARNGSGDAVAWYDPDRDAGSSDRPALLAELRSALAREDELLLALQPVVDLASGAPIAVEALVRWRHPVRGLLPPADFLRAVENSDLLPRFTGYILDRALATAARLARAGPAVPVAVNLSARSLLDPDLPEQVLRLLRAHRVPGRRLILEITETVVASQQPGVAEALAGLRSLGVRLAVDDFGTGHASLSFLTRVPLDEVKVDGAFVARMDTEPAAAAIVRATIELGRELGLRVVAEGVETADQLRWLRGLGCTAVQGFHFGEPVPADLVATPVDALGVPG